MRYPESAMTVANIELPEAELRAFCEKWGIIELALFGSVLRDDFGPDSDIDVLVTFREESAENVFNRPAMKDELWALFGRPVDLVNRRAIEQNHNWKRRKQILGSARVVIAA